jgi:hypothetical protein
MALTGAKLAGGSADFCADDSAAKMSAGEQAIRTDDRRTVNPLRGGQKTYGSRRLPARHSPAAIAVGYEFAPIGDSRADWQVFFSSRNSPRRSGIRILNRLDCHVLLDTT